MATGRTPASSKLLLKSLLAAVVAFLAGCGPPRMAYPDSLHSQRPDERACAACHAGRIKDRSVIGVLIDRLEDEDEAVRFYAILALEQMTGTRLGYCYHAPASERRRAVQRWQAYLASGAATRPSAANVSEFPVSSGQSPVTGDW